MALCRDPWGAIHISAPGGGIGIYDHVLDSITTIQFSDFGAVLDILFPTDSTMILLGYEHLAIVKNNGTILQEEVFPDQQLLSGFLSNGNLVMNILEISQNKHRFVLMNPDLSLINSIQAFSDDTRIQTVLKGKNAHLVFGQESQNVFMKSIDFAGQVEPLRQDAAITNMTWTDITTSVVKQVYCRPEVAFSGLEIEIQNNGLDTLNSVLVNWNEQVQFSYNTSWCQSFSRQFPLEKLKLPPGATIWVPLPEITFFKDIPCDSSYQFDICFELSTPNNRIDANHSNDKFCVPIDVKTTSTADLKSDRHVLVYPDPFSYTLHLDNLPNTTKNVQLLDLFGRVISAQPVSAGTSFSFDLPNGPSGLYLLVISDEDGQIIETKRLLRVD
ncbi:MAG: T9SS type A sorting domain-containing protein [Saprospiraceae bacterium]|nr:T9SS type A sorting domain-containing protein [Saprospiraceae bacterium]